MMFRPNAERILEELQADSLVLDIGGWASPFRRANYVMDILPYETRKVEIGVGDLPESFSSETWIVRDICDREPFPFKNREFDFVICSQVLEDVRDPISVCSEMIRVAKAGYLEVPAVWVDLTLGVRDRRYAGHPHHRWIVDIQGNRVRFFFKTHLIYKTRRLHLPPSILKRKGPTDIYSYLFWKDSFEYEEATPTIGTDGTPQEIEGIVRGQLPRGDPSLRLIEMEKTLKERMPDPVRRLLVRIFRRRSRYMQWVHDAYENE